MTARRLHLVGASGSGTTTLGRALARHLDCPHFDTDDYFWLPSDPPFELIRDRATRQALLGHDLQHHPAWVLSGSLCGWGDVPTRLARVLAHLDRRETPTAARRGPTRWCGPPA
jgi:hypothetical protein